jgi:hypothetical protein
MKAIEAGSSYRVEISRRTIVRRARDGNGFGGGCLGKLQSG